MAALILSMNALAALGAAGCEDAPAPSDRMASRTPPEPSGARGAPASATTHSVMTGGRTSDPPPLAQIGSARCAHICQKSTRCGVERAAQQATRPNVKENIAASEAACARACNEGMPPATDTAALDACLPRGCDEFMPCLQRALGQALPAAGASSTH